MRKRVSYLLLLGATAVFAGCSKDVDGELVTPTVVAGLRYVNLVPDTGGMDIRIVDVIGDAPNTYNATFRTGGAPYGVAITGLPLHTAVLAGTRSIRAFMSSTDPAVASIVMLDTTFNFAAGANYTVYLYGYASAAGTPSLQALITADTLAAAIPAGNIAIRTINLAPNFQPTSASTSADVYVAAAATAPAGAPRNAAVGAGSASAYVNVPVGTGLQALVTPAGATTPLVAGALLPAGTAGTATANPVPGTNVAGTAISLILTPRTVSGTAATSSFAGQAAVSLAGNADSTVTATTPVAHGLAVGALVTVGCAVATTNPYNGGFTILSVPTATTFTYKTTNVGTAQTGYAIWYPTAQAARFNGQCVTSATAAGTAVTVTTTSNHGLAVNDIITINGADQAEYNGTFVVASAPSTTTFTYTANAAPAAATATGPVVWRRGVNDYTRPDVLFIVDQLPPRTAP